MFMKRILPAICASLLFAIFFAASITSPEEIQIGQDVEEIVSKIVDAHGGIQALSHITTVHAKGFVTAVFRKDEGSYERWLVRDRKLRVETLYSRSKEYRVLNGTRGFRGTANTTMTEVTDQQYEAMVYQYKQLEMPYAFSKRLHKIAYVGEAEVKGKPAVILDVTDEEGPPMKVYADKASFLIVKTAGFFTVSGRNTDLSVEFADYRKIGGILLPFRITNYGSGYRIGETVIEKYELNSIMGDSLFEPHGNSGF